MSCIYFAWQKRVVWTDTNDLGLTQAWVDRLVSEGYELDDRRVAKLDEDHLK